MPIQQMLLGVGAGTAEGQVVLTNPTTSWTVPAGVESVSVVCIGAGGCGATNGAGGGALAYGNNISVTPGSSITVSIGAQNDTRSTNGGDTWFSADTVLKAQGGRWAQNLTSASSGSARTGGGTGGAGGVDASFWSSHARGGGGGAGGYNGNGGNGGHQGFGTPNLNPATAGGSDAAGGGGYSSFSSAACDGGGGGGGSGLIGTSSSSTGGSAGDSYVSAESDIKSGGDGQGNANHNTVGRMSGGQYGGGSGGFGSSSCSEDTFGGAGAIRIIWPGDSRSFPNTNCGDV